VLLNPRPTPKLEYIRSCFSYLEVFPSIRNVRMRYAVLTRDPPNRGHYTTTAKTH